MGSMPPTRQAPTAHTHAGCSRLQQSPRPLALALLGPWPSPGLRPSSQDRTCEVVEDAESNRMVKKMKKRICLVLDCLCAHDFSDKTADLINLQHYVIKEKRLSERETVVIFYDVVRVVEALHQVRPCPAAPSSAVESRPRLLVTAAALSALARYALQLGRLDGERPDATPEDAVPQASAHDPGAVWAAQQSPAQLCPPVERLGVSYPPGAATACL